MGVVGDRNRDVAALVPACIRGEDERGVVGVRASGAEEEATPQRVRIVQLVAAISLEPALDDAAGDGRSHAVEDEVGRVVRMELDVVVLAERSHLEVELAQRFLQRQDPERVDFLLLLVHVLRVEGGDTREREGQGLVRVVGYVEPTVVVAHGEAHPRRRVGECGEDPKDLSLLGEIVDRVGSRRLDASIRFQVRTRKEVVDDSRGAARLEARLDQAIAAAVNPDAPFGLERALLGLDVDDSRGAIAILGGKRAGEQRRIAHHSGVEHWGEGCETPRQQNPVDPVLDVGVLAPDVQLPVGIVGHARRPQDDLIEGRILAVRLCLDRLLGDVVVTRSDCRRDALAALVEPFGDDAQVEGRGRREHQLGARFLACLDGHDGRPGFEVLLLADDGIHAGVDASEGESPFRVALRASGHGPSGRLEPQRHVRERSVERILHLPLDGALRSRVSERIARQA